MNLKKELRQDLTQAMRDRDERRKAALRMALAGIQLAEVENKGALEDVAIIRVLQREIRRREEALEMAKQAGREDLVADDVLELNVLKSYLPQPLSEEELKALIREVILEVGATSSSDLGKVMQVIMPKVTGKADGRVVNQIVRDMLSNPSA